MGVKDKLESLFTEEELNKLVKKREHENKIKEALAPIHEAIKIEEARHADAMFKLEQAILSIQQECKHDWRVERRHEEPEPDVEYGFGGTPTYKVNVCRVCGEETTYDVD